MVASLAQALTTQGFQRLCTGLVLLASGLYNPLNLETLILQGTQLFDLDFCQSISCTGPAAKRLRWRWTLLPGL